MSFTLSITVSFLVKSGAKSNSRLFKISPMPLQRQVFFLEFQTTDDITDDSDGKKNCPFPYEGRCSVKNGNHVEQRYNRHIVESVQCFHTDNGREYGRTEQSEHCGDKEEHIKPAAESHGMLTAVEVTRSEETNSAHRKHYKECAEIDQCEFSVSKFRGDVNDCKANHTCKSRAEEHYKNGTDQEHCLRKRYLFSLRSGGEDICQIMISPFATPTDSQ